LRKVWLALLNRLAGRCRLKSELINTQDSSPKSKVLSADYPKIEKWRLTGEKLTWANAGFPTVNCHLGTNTETTISNKVEIPATNAIKLIFCIKFAVSI